LIDLVILLSAFMGLRFLIVSLSAGWLMKHIRAAREVRAFVRDRARSQANPGLSGEVK